MRWRAQYGRNTYGRRPTVGQVIARDFAAWRVIAITDIEPIDLRDTEAASGAKPYHLVIRPAAEDPELITRHGDQHFRVAERTEFSILGEHYVVCGKCGDVPPCRSEYQDTAAAAAMDELERFEDPAKCPACHEVVTERQKSITFEVNTHIPGGPPVTYHRRRVCFHEAIRYDASLALAEGRAARLSCGGRLRKHSEIPDVCSLPTCPGPEVQHRSFFTCNCARHGCLTAAAS